MKRYGNERTSLKLSENALKIYSESDPLDIYEKDDGSYKITGIIEADGLTADEVNQLIENL